MKIRLRKMTLACSVILALVITATPGTGFLAWLHLSAPHELTSAFAASPVPLGPGGDYRSSVSQLILVLWKALVAVLLVECGKVLALSSADARTRITVHLGLVMTQLALVFETIRIEAYDWFVFVASFTPFMDLKTDPYSRIDRLIPVRFPLLSLLLGAATLTAYYLIEFRSRHEIDRTTPRSGP